MGSLFESGLLAVGVALLAASVLMGVRRKRAAQAGRPTARDKLEELQHRSAVRGDLESLMVEIEAMARRMGAQLDAKAVHLEMLLREADARVEQLKGAGAGVGARVGSESKGGGEANGEVTGDPSPSPGADGLRRESLTRAVAALADEGLTGREIATRLGEHQGTVELILGLRASRV